MKKIILIVAIIWAQKAQATEYAKIVTGAVARVVVADATFISNQAGTWALTPGGIGEGYKYSNGIFLTQLGDQSIAIGAALNLKITGFSSVSLGYQWKKNGSNIGGATSGTYTVNVAGPGDSGSYTCTVSTSANTLESNAVTVTVN